MGSTLHVANTGDSRAVLGLAARASRITTEHNLKNSEAQCPLRSPPLTHSTRASQERRRIHSKGGRVLDSRVLIPGTDDLVQLGVNTVGA